MKINVDDVNLQKMSTLKTKVIYERMCTTHKELIREKANIFKYNISHFPLTSLTSMTTCKTASCLTFLVTAIIRQCYRNDII